MTDASIRTGKGSLLVIFLTVFIDLLGFGMVLPLLPLYADQYAAGGWQLGLLMASFSAMQFIFAPMWGRLSDVVGRRPVLMVGLAGSVGFYLLFAAATIWRSLSLLFVARIGAGIAGATISTAQAYIADTTTLANRSKGMALIGMAFGLGFTFGPLLGFLAAPSENSTPGPWPGYVAALLSAVALAMAWKLLPESHPRLSAGETPAASEGPPASPGARGPILDLGAFWEAASIPSIGLILASIFVCIFSFANFETTLSLLIKGGKTVDSPFGLSWGQVCLTYAYIGLTLALVQGGLVRRLSGRVTEAAMALTGGSLQIVGFLLMLWACNATSSKLLFLSLTLVVAGFAFMQPSLNALLSRRSDPKRQGVILGVGQSVSSLARIVGSGFGIPLLSASIYAPYVLAIGLMTLGATLVVIAGRSGRDFP